MSRKGLRYSAAFEYKEARYKAMLILLWTKLSFDRRIAKLQDRRPDIRTEEELDDELELEYHVSLMFASESVLAALESFLKEPNQEAWKAVAIQMRKDLYD